MKLIVCLTALLAVAIPAAADPPAWVPVAEPGVFHFELVGDRLYAFHYVRGRDATDEKRFDRLLASFALD